MRVLTFLHSFEPGGVERVALRLVAHWRALGVEAPLFLGREDGPLRAELASGLAYDVPRQPRFGSGWWETMWMIATLPAAIRRHRPDVLFCAGSTYTIVAVAMKLLLGRACPPVVAKISNDVARRDLPAPARLAWRLWLRVQAHVIDRWIVMEEAMVDDVRAAMGAVRYAVVPDPAISLAQIAPRAPRRVRAPEDGRRFVAIGRLAAQKDYPLMLAAFAGGSTPADRLTIYGGGPLEARLRALAADLGIARRVTFAGHVADAAARLAEHDIYLLSSAYEGVPAVLVEALACGLPIVATACGPGVDGLLDHGRLGRIVARDADALAVAIAAARRRTRVDPTAFAQARRFTIEGAAGAYLAAFGTACEDARPTIPGPATIKKALT